MLEFATGVRRYLSEKHATCLNLGGLFRKIEMLVIALLLSVSGITTHAAAVNRAITIQVGSIGSPADKVAVRVVRKVVASAIANAVVDKFEVANFPLGAPAPIEGGFSACAEAGYKISAGRFNAFIQELKSIQPKPGAFYSLTPVESCHDVSVVSPPLCEGCGPIEPEPTFCAQDALICPDGTGVGRVAPSCEFAPCPAPK
jgi:hypothetical protein